MLQCVHQFVHIYSRLADGEHVVIMTLHPSGAAVEVQVFNRSGESTSRELSETNMALLKSGCHDALPWPIFFDLLQKAFAEHTLEYTASQLKVTVKHERQTDMVPIAPFSTTLLIPFNKPLSERSEPLFDAATSMISYVALRSGDRKEMERLEGIQRMEREVKEEVVHVRQEISVLEQETKGLMALKSYADDMQKRTVELRGSDSSLSKLAEEAVSNPSAVDKIFSRVTDPLRDVPGNCKSYNADLLAVIKGIAMMGGAVGAGGLAATDPPDDSGRAFDAIPNPSKEKREALQRDLSNNSTAGPVIRMCIQADDWDFDIFRFDATCKAAAPSQNRPAGALFYLGYLVMWRLGLLVKFNFSEKCLLRWLSVVEEGYKANLPYHNSLHAADVLQAVYHFLIACDGARMLGMSDSDILALVLASLIVDFKHPGTDNLFQQRTRSDLACIFAYESPLEQMHFVSIMELMKLNRYNLLRLVEPSIRDSIEETVGHLVLATDFERHDTFLAAFRLVLNEVSNVNPSNPGENLCIGADSLLVMCIMIKAADVSSCARKEELYTQWVTRKQNENQMQGHLEAQAGLQPSPFMGNGIMFHTALAQLQLAIINIIAVPVYTHLSDVLPKLRITGEHVSRNRARWTNAEENEALGTVT